MIKYLFILCLITSAASASELKELALEYHRFHDNERSLQLPGEPPKEGLNLSMGLSPLSDHLLWWNQIRALTTDGQYRYIAWNFRLGIQVTQSIHLGYEHLSQHLLDTTDQVYPGHKYPSEDSLFLRWDVVTPDRARPLF